MTLVVSFYLHFFFLCFTSERERREGSKLPRRFGPGMSFQSGSESVEGSASARASPFPALPQAELPRLVSAVGGREGGPASPPLLGLAVGRPRSPSSGGGLGEFTSLWDPLLSLWLPLDLSCPCCPQEPMAFWTRAGWALS